ncbi:uncharacterized protein LOC129611259 [Condylostylus longicornis]|uniref:uncharacterized protein LOC129611259 n=1 Tax=Condylostylus longicornis TaxID=2530218 RepID=UPI00244DCB44|nr:uncharacterized protein LOC129611259 [Condylostylus longicornis]
MTENDSGKCALCGCEAKSFCSACRTTKYCSVEHQKKHWKQHKIDCQPYKIVATEDMGRVLIATRDILAKNIIFVESPICVGPKWFISDRDETIPIFPCVGCYSPCKIGIHSCPRCKWPSCSPMCPGLDNPKLHSLECPILSLGPGPTDSNSLKSLMDYYRADSLFVLKCLLLQWKQPKKWEDLLNMQSHEDERLGSELYLDAQKRIVSFLHDNFLSNFKKLQEQSQTQILKKYDENILHKICGIIETNYMCINLLNGLELSGIFAIACMMEHNCQPNCYFLFDHQNGFKISVIAGRDIKQGEHLKIMYSNMLWGTHMRQEHLQMTKHFNCKCERCCDPTEFGTYFSALKCVGDENKTCDGIKLPKNPLSLTSNWHCNKCPVQIGYDEINYLISQMGEEVENLLSSKPTIKEIETLIDKLSNFLHPNHYHLFNLKHSLIQLYGSQTGYTLDKLSDDLLQKKMYICNDLLNICDKLDPFTIRLSIYVGIILFEMHNVLVEFTKRMLKERSLSLSPPSPLELIGSTITDQNRDDSPGIEENNEYNKDNADLKNLNEIMNKLTTTAVNNGNNENGQINNGEEATSDDSGKVKEQVAYNLKLARDYLLRAAEVLKKELDNVAGSKLSDAVIKGISSVDNLLSNHS